MKIKVLFIISNLAGGGAERILINILRNIDRNKIEPSCIFFNSNHKYEVPKNIKVWTLKPNSEEENHCEQISKIINKEKPDIVNSYITPINLVVLLSRINWHYKPGLIIREGTNASLLEDVSTKKYVKLLYPRADKIITISKGVKKDLIENFGLDKKKIKVIYNGLEIKEIRRLSKEPVIHPWFAGEMPIIISAGRLIPCKGFDYLIKALKIVRTKIDCRLIIMGEGQQQNELENLTAELRLNDSVDFVGFKKNPFKYMSKASVFTLASMREGFSNVIVEAMACGTPVVSTDCCFGPGEIIKDKNSGILVPIKNTHKLAEAIMNILNNKLYARKIAAAAMRSIGRFSVNRMVNKYMQVFEESV